MVDARRYAPWIVFGIGMVLILASDLLEPARQVDLLATVGGGVVAFVGILWSELRSTHGCLVDERYAEIHHRSGYLGFVVMGSLLVMSLVVVTTGDLEVALELVIAGAIVGGFASYYGSVAWLKRAM